MENGGFTHGKWRVYPWKMVIEPAIFGKNRDLWRLFGSFFDREKYDLIVLYQK